MRITNSLTLGYPQGAPLQVDCGELQFLQVIKSSSLIEVNDGYSVGGYGLFPVDYAQFLSARWAELTNTKDYGKY